MIRKFKDDEMGCLLWVQKHQAGYVVNIDEPNRTPHYSMVHRASHKTISSITRTNYTTGRYLKYCSRSLEALEAWPQEHHGRALTRYMQCI